MQVTLAAIHTEQLFWIISVRRSYCCSSIYLKPAPHGSGFGQKAARRPSREPQKAVFRAARAAAIATVAKKFASGDNIRLMARRQAVTRGAVDKDRGDKLAHSSWQRFSDRRQPGLNQLRKDFICLVRNCAHGVLFFCFLCLVCVATPMWVWIEGTKRHSMLLV